jgi:DNA polymerase bacteriophage-type
MSTTKGLAADYLFMDFETRNKHDLQIVGLDNYARSAEVLMLAWARNKTPTQLWTPDQSMPAELHESILNPAILKVAWYATFERTILRHVLGIGVPIEEWRDPMILARCLSMPGKLKRVCQILKLSAEEAKIADGERLLHIFSEPNGEEGEETLFGVNSGFNEGIDHPKDWELLKEYCIRDVDVERKLWYDFSSLFGPPHYESFDWTGWFFDQRMNEFGMPINIERARKALALAVEFKRRTTERMIALTGLENPNSPKQLMPWVQARGYKWGTLLKSTVEMELKDKTSRVTKEAREVLQLRLDSSQNSYQKLEGILNEVGPDRRLRYQYMYMGASRTGRWSAGGIQVMNFPRPIKSVKKNLKRALELVDAEDYEGILKEFGPILPFVASCVRMVVEVPDAA